MTGFGRSPSLLLWEVEVRLFLKNSLFLRAAAGTTAVFSKGLRRCDRVTAQLEEWRGGPGLEFLGEALDPFPDFMAGFVQAILGGVVMDPDVSGERAKRERAFGVDSRALKAASTRQHPARHTREQDQN